MEQRGRGRESRLLDEGAAESLTEDDVQDLDGRQRALVQVAHARLRHVHQHRSHRLEHHRALRLVPGVLRQTDIGLQAHLKPKLGRPLSLLPTFAYRRAVVRKLDAAGREEKMASVVGESVSVREDVPVVGDQSPENIAVLVSEKERGGLKAGGGGDSLVQLASAGVLYLDVVLLHHQVLANELHLEEVAPEMDRPPNSPHVRTLRQLLL